MPVTRAEEGEGDVLLRLQAPLDRPQHLGQLTAVDLKPLDLAVAPVVRRHVRRARVLEPAAVQQNPVTSILQAMSLKEDPPGAVQEDRLR